MLKIRKYQEKDKPAAVKILVETSRIPAETEKDLAYLRLMYNDYYTEVEPENCFVAVNEDDEAVGYIICASDHKRFKRLFKKFYLPEIKELGRDYYTRALMDIYGHIFFEKKYTAHLHINVLSVCQGQGTGSQLMDALKNELRLKGVKGLMLSCAADNDGAIRFYKRNGFKELLTIAGGCIMATEL